MHIYFFNSAVAELYQNDIIPIAEGLKESGYSFHSRHDYWREEPGGEFLFKANPEVVPEECDLVIGTYMLFGVSKHDQSAEQEVFVRLMKKRSANTKLVFIDDSDGYTTPSWRPEFRGCDLICRTKYNRHAYVPPNAVPWAIGLTNRTLRMAASVPEPTERQEAIYVNYGASHPFEHTTRLKAKNLLHPALAPELETYQPPFAELSLPPKDPYDRLMWEQTSKRHSRIYFERMKSCLVSSAFCGDEIPAAPWNPQGYCVGGGKARLKRSCFDAVQRFDPRPLRVISGDSFRFWESLACGTMPMQVDYEHYGLKMSVQPEPYIHYLPVRFDDLDKSVSLIKTQLNSLKSVGDEARGWAIANYCPRVVAQRFLCVSDEARSRLSS
ncbi:MAG: hypothetical protein WCI38_12725 [Chthoniobacterales bacterium]|jgi:hypothetical protein